MVEVRGRPGTSQAPSGSSCQPRGGCAGGVAASGAACGSRRYAPAQRQSVLKNCAPAFPARLSPRKCPDAPNAAAQSAPAFPAAAGTAQTRPPPPRPPAAAAAAVAAGRRGHEPRGRLRRHLGARWQLLRRTAPREARRDVGAAARRVQRRGAALPPVGTCGGCWGARAGGGLRAELGKGGWREELQPASRAWRVSGPRPRERAAAGSPPRKPAAEQGSSRRQQQKHRRRRR